jgi:hypothetical protein
MIRHDGGVDPHRHPATTFKGHLRVLLSAMDSPTTIPTAKTDPVTKLPALS